MNSPPSRLTLIPSEILGQIVSHLTVRSLYGLMFECGDLKLLSRLSSLPYIPSLKYESTHSKWEDRFLRLLGRLKALQRLELKIFGFSQSGGCFASSSLSSLVSSIPSHVMEISLTIHGFKQQWQELDMAEKRVFDISLISIFSDQSPLHLPNMPSCLTRLRISSRFIPMQWASETLKSLIHLESLILTVFSHLTDIDPEEPEEDMELWTAMYQFDLDWIACLEKMRFLVLHVKSLFFDPNRHLLPSLKYLQFMPNTIFITPGESPVTVQNSPEIQEKNFYCFSRIVSSDLKVWGNLNPSFDPFKLNCWPNIEELSAMTWKSPLLFPTHLTSLKLNHPAFPRLIWEEFVPSLPRTLVSLSMTATLPEKAISKLPPLISNLELNILSEHLESRTVQWPHSLTSLYNHLWIDPLALAADILNRKCLRHLPPSVMVYGNSIRDLYSVRAVPCIGKVKLSEEYHWITIDWAIRYDLPEALSYIMSVDNEQFVINFTSIGTLFMILSERASKIANWFLKTVSCRSFLPSLHYSSVYYDSRMSLTNFISMALSDAPQHAKTMIKLVLAFWAPDDIPEYDWHQIIAIKNCNLSILLEFLKERQKERRTNCIFILSQTRFISWVRMGYSSIIQWILDDWRQSKLHGVPPLLDFRNFDKSSNNDDHFHEISSKTILDIFCECSSSERTGKCLDLLIPEVFRFKPEFNLSNFLAEYSSRLGELGIFDAILWTVKHSSLFANELKEVKLLENILSLSLVLSNDPHSVESSSMLIQWIIEQGYPIANARIGLNCRILLIFVFWFPMVSNCLFNITI